MAPLPLQPGADHRQTWPWPTVEEGSQYEEQLEGDSSVQLANQINQMTLLGSGNAQVPVTEKSEASSRGRDSTDTGNMNDTLTGPNRETLSIVGFSECREESKNGLQQTGHHVQLTDLPNEVLYEILSHLDVCDLFSASKVSSFFFLIPSTRLLQFRPFPFAIWNFLFITRFCDTRPF